MHKTLSAVFLVAVGGVVSALPCAIAQQPNLADNRASETPPVQTPATLASANIADWIDQQLPGLLQAYQTLHRNPELSWQETETAALIAGLWREEGFEITTGIGPDPSAGGGGVVGILRNGQGPTLMLRCDMDGLPVTEQTQLPYASTKTVSLPGGISTGVMHACGHDIHMTNLVAVARYMATHRDDWSGTLMVIAQPAEEKGEGARAMIDDGLFTRFAKPDFAVALHVAGDTAAGQVAVLPGYSQANVDSVDIDVKGRGGHGAAPETTIDPIVQAADLVMALQTIVSREVKPIDPAVITVGAIAGGTKHNIIGNTCHLQLTVRTYGDEVRAQVLAAIRRKANAIAQSYGAPPPELVFSQGTPSLENDAELAGRLRQVFVGVLGAENVVPNQPSMGGEDFSRYGREGVPILMYKLGSVNQSRLDRFEKLGVPPPSLHSSAYYPDVEPTLRTSVLTMTAAALDLLSPKPE
ncbi:putative hydrolase YxeP [Rubripirellula lacrimiformis]|uniref:Putative hydrolase YxeP n=1 Tax=Rubripirellula lacrimiformis TaxID=1930273 RepID=A0A517NG47_9BACT|nr:amidohydrolase [Rubripirellula lacrimiformis]QDT06104.1 putative hydrolase YxeP [Rubripirellula lacrimiformis]